MTPTGQANLNELLKSMKPMLHPGEYVFCVAEDISSLSPNDIVMSFREDEGNTLIIKKETANNLGFSNICGIFEKSILVKGGYIIRINPIAKGILVVPDENELIKSSEFGIK